MIMSSFKFVFSWLTSSFHISSLVFNNSLSNLATLLNIMHSFQLCVNRFSLTGPSQKLKTLWKGQLSCDLLLSFPINSFKALFFKKIVPVQDNFYQWYFLLVTAYINFCHINCYVGIWMKKNCMAIFRTMGYNQKTRTARKGRKVNHSSNFLTVIMRCAYICYKTKLNSG